MGRNANVPQAIHQKKLENLDNCHLKVLTTVHLHPSNTAVTIFLTTTEKSDLGDLRNAKCPTELPVYRTNLIKLVQRRALVS